MEHEINMFLCFVKHENVAFLCYMKHIMVNFAKKIYGTI